MQECDLVMKGGTTSGVVYPYAIFEIAGSYRLRSIGGASAGAIAASLAAAAEYRRQSSEGADDFSGFEGISDLAQELAEDLTDFLQPTPQMRPVFEAFLEVMRQRRDVAERPVGIGGRLRNLWVLLGKLTPYWQKPVMVGGAVTAFSLAIGLMSGSFGVALLGVLLALALFAVMLVRTLYRDILVQLRMQDFGLVPGTTQDGFDAETKPAICDWLADKIDAIAQLDEDRPLTIGDLSERDIVLATMTTDLTAQRPYSLPFKVPEQYYFDPTELVDVLPRRVVDWMVTQTGSGKVRTQEGRLIYPVPVGKDFPVILAARMSLSFPILLQAVPLWRRDTLDFAEDDAARPWVRCLFSDGGISSSLPIHFFDEWFPRRPTIAISLGHYDEARHGPPSAEGHERVHFSNAVPDRLVIPTVRVDSLLSFAKSILTSAKDWQDKLQSQLPGFSDRVATIRLKDTEGGLNLDMPPPLIQDLQRYGRLAGKKIVDEFDVDENRWRRALSLLPEVEKMLEDVWDAATRVQGGPNNWTYAEMLAQHVPSAYAQDPVWRKTVLLEFVEKLVEIGAASAAADDDKKISGGNLPHADAALRLVATPDLTENKTRAATGATFVSSRTGS